MRTTNIRFQEKREEDDRAWDILHKLEELNHYPQLKEKS